MDFPTTSSLDRAAKMGYWRIACLPSAGSSAKWLAGIMPVKLGNTPCINMVIE